MAQQKWDRAQRLGLEGVQDLSTLVEYQEGSVVSRTLVDKQTGTVTMFAFEKEQGLSEHTTPYDTLVYVVDGKAAISVSGQRHEVILGEMIIMPANEPHELKAEDRFKMLLVMIRS